MLPLDVSAKQGYFEPLHFFRFGFQFFVATTPSVYGLRHKNHRLYPLFYIYIYINIYIPVFYCHKTLSQVKIEMIQLVSCFEMLQHSLEL